MSEMVERVAKALCDLDGADPEYLEPGDALGIDGYVNGEPCHFFWRHFIEPARAAIEAMREPTEAMAYDGADATQDARLHDAEACWRAMIDAALKDDASPS